MKTFKLEAWKKKYPCLRELLQREGENGMWQDIPAQEIDSVTLAEVSADVLREVPVYTSWVGSVVNSWHREAYHLVLTNGSIRLNFATAAEDHGSNYAHSSRTRREGEMLAEAIDRLCLANRISMIVNSSRGRDDNNDVEEYRRITLYRWKKGSPIDLTRIKLEEEQEVDLST